MSALPEIASFSPAPVYRPTPTGSPTAMSPQLVHVADSPSPLLGYPSSDSASLTTASVALASRPIPLIPPLSPTPSGNMAATTTTGSPVVIPVPDYVWRQLLTIVQSQSAPTGQPPTSTNLTTSAAPPLKSSPPEKSSQYKNRQTPFHKSAPLPEEDAPALDEDVRIPSLDDDGGKADSRRLVRRFENQLVDFVQTHPAARERLEQVQDKVNDLLSNPDSAAEALRYEFQHRHPLLKWSIRIARPLLVHEIKQLPDREDERAPFLNRQFVLNLFNFLTESERQHRNRSQPLLDVG